MIHSMGGGEKGQPGAKGQDSEGDLHIINQLRKIYDMHMPMEVKFLDMSYLTVTYPVARRILEVYEDLKTSIEKEAMIYKLWKDSSTISKISEFVGMINNKNNKKEQYNHVTTVGKDRPSE